jgi:hypothetical protein
VLASTESTDNANRASFAVGGDDDMHAVGLAGAAEVFEGVTGA